MNGHCSTCDVEKQCGYQYKPCDCCNYRKFKPLPPTEAKVIQFPKKENGKVVPASPQEQT